MVPFFSSLKSSLELAAVGNPRGLFHSLYFIKLALSGNVELSQDDLDEHSPSTQDIEIEFKHLFCGNTHTKYCTLCPCG